MTYESWRATFQSSEQAARAAYQELQAALENPVKVSVLVDQIDLMADEFQRIKALHPMPEIVGICDRAMQVTEQNIPVIEQRNRLIKEVNRFLARHPNEPPVWHTCPECGSLMTLPDPANSGCRIWFCGECGFNDSKDDDHG